MDAQSALGQTQEERLQEILAAYLRDVEAGRNPDQSEILARHPDLAGELREFFDGREQVGRLAAPLRQVVETTPDAGITGTLGDFRILREVGRGGMGIVYEAEQISLRRRVALKVLPFAATMDPRHLQRFHNEAQAAACLHHTNIVPVHFVGCERGVHFYAMQFIDGQPLSDVIRQMRRLENKAPAAGENNTVAYQPAPGEADSTPLPAAEMTPLTGEGRRSRDYYRKVAELGVQAGEALDHAHQVGIVHRDIKPANLMLDPRGNLWVTDFGLAHMQHGEASLTCTGQMVGTPRYMSPEQALAKRVPIDHRTDVYSLGATLYEMLTLRPAFANEDREELLRQIASEEPAKPRRLERTIPAELEIIVLKAMEKRPQDRYTTAQELADDLRRWLLDQPIRARRPSVFQTTAKWARRHTPAVVAGAVVIMMALAMASYLGLARHDRMVRRAANDRVVLAALEDSRSWLEQGRLPEALSAARRADGVAAGVDVDVTLRQQARARLADLELLANLEDIRLVNETKVKEGYFDDGAIDALFGSAFQDAGLDVDALPPDVVAARIRASSIATELAAALDYWSHRSKNMGGTGQRWKQLLQIARAVDSDPWRTRMREALEKNDYQSLRKLATGEEVLRLPPPTLFVLGSALMHDREAKAQVERFLREAQRRYPNDFWLNYNLFFFFGVTKQPPQCEEAFPFAVATVAIRPDSPGAHLNLGRILVEKGRLDEAIAECRLAIVLKKDFADAYINLGAAFYRKGQLDDGIAAFRYATHLNKYDGIAHYNLGKALKDKGQLEEAIMEYRASTELNKKYYPSHYDLGFVLQAKGRLDEAITEYREAIRLKNDYASAHNNLGVALYDKGQLDEAITEYREAIRLKNDYASPHNNLGQALKDKGRLGEAIAEYREAIRLKLDGTQVHFNLGLALQAKGQPDEAIKEYREVIRIDNDHPQAHYNLGLALQKKGQSDEAIKEYREAIRLKRTIPEAHVNLGGILAAKGQLDEAIAEFREAILHKKDLAVAHYNLGSVLYEKGEPDAAIASLREAIRLKKGYTDAHDNLKNALALKETLSKLGTVVSGNAKADNPEEQLALANVCQKPYKRLYAAAARFYSDAFAAQARLADNLNAQHRYSAACSAALAGCGQGADADKVDTKERARLRQQAIDWLRADLKAYRQVLEKSPGKAGPAIAQRMQHWLQDTDFAGVRGDEALAKLPAEEQSAWRKLWADVAELLANAQGKTPAEKKSDTKSPPCVHTGA